MDSYPRVIVGTDGSSDAEAAVHVAAHFAGKLNAPLDVVAAGAVAAIEDVVLAMSDDPLHDDATAVLRQLVGRDDVTFRDGQLEAIEALVGGGRRVLVVQRTGWGKSAVYFLSALLLRARGRGPTLIVSPLLALMRDQVAAAARAGDAAGAGTG